MSNLAKTLPFSLDRKSRTALTDQLVDGLRRAINDGYYRPGDVLPTWKNLSETLGVSLRIPREALRRLSQEGVVLARRRLGSVVQRTTEKRSWKGTVLCVCYDSEWHSYYRSVMFSSFRQILARNGYVAIPFDIRQTKYGAPDLSASSSILDFKIDFAVVMCHHARVLNWFSRFGIPFLAYGGMACQRVPNLVGVPDVWDVRQAKEDFLAHCRRARIRRVLQISFCAGPSVDMLPAFRRAGIEAEGWLVPPVKGICRQEGIREAVRRAVAKRFADARSLPDLVFFTDDFVAAGGLLALAQCGVRVPEDVRVVTLANEGDLPVSMCSLTCILSSPVERGVLMARRVLAALSRTRLPAGADSVPKISYRIGESFPDK